MIDGAPPYSIAPYLAMREIAIALIDGLHAELQTVLASQYHHTDLKIDSIDVPEAQDYFLGTRVDVTSELGHRPSIILISQYDDTQELKKLGGALNGHELTLISTPIEVAYQMRPTAGRQVVNDYSKTFEELDYSTLIAALVATATEEIIHREVRKADCVETLKLVRTFSDATFASPDAPLDQFVGFRHLFDVEQQAAHPTHTTTT